jgi:hypothetical protein
MKQENKGVKNKVATQISKKKSGTHGGVTTDGNIIVR